MIPLIPLAMQLGQFAPGIIKLLSGSDLADVQNARTMPVAALTQDDIFSKRFVYYFASAWSLFAMACFTAVTFIDIAAEGGQREADTILGVLITSVIGSCSVSATAAPRAVKPKARCSRRQRRWK